MDQTPNLELPFIMAAQAQKHITHNEALRILDAVVQLAVIARDLASPPGSPDDGARYIVAAGASGAWSGRSDDIAAWQDGAWVFFNPHPGWTAWVNAEAKLVAWNGSAWIAVVEDSLNPISLVGINTTADTTNRLAVSSPATLLGHEGAGHQLKINKNAASDTASLLLQTGFSGRAEVGTCGNDDLHVKVSADGTTWREALIIDKDTAEVIATASSASAVPLSLMEAASQTAALLCLAGSTGVPLFERPASKSLNARNWRMIVNQNAFASGGLGDEAYNNEVVGLGWNMSGTIGVPAVSGAGMIWDTWEYKFFSGGKYIHERHFETLDTSGTQHRFMSFGIAHDGTGGGGTIKASQFIFRNWADTDSINMVFDPVTAAANVTFYGGGGIGFANNNYAPMGQKNAAGTAYLNLPYYNQNDRLVLGANILLGGTAPYSGFPGVDLAFSGAVGSGGRIISALATADSGSANINSLHFYAFTSGEYKAQFWNGQTSGGSATVDVRTQSSTGKAYYRASQVSGQQWSWGMNASQNYVLTGSSDLGSNTVYTVDKTNRNVAFTNPPKLPSYTVAGVPSASTYGAGSMIYVSNESGGAVPAFSDGTNWRRVTDGAVVS